MAASAPAPAERLLISADLHLTAQEAAQDGALDALLRSARDADGLILLGDITNNGRPEEHRRLAGILLEAQASCPVYVLPGNHDISARFGSAAFASLYAPFGFGQAVSRHDASLSYAVRTQAGTLLIMLDLNRTDARGQADPYGRVTDSLLAWLSQTLADADPARTVVCAHYPIQPVLTETVADREKLFSLLTGKGVRLYLCGHRHLHGTFQAAGLRQITAGRPENFPFWAGQLTVLPEGFVYTALPLFAPDSPEYLAGRQAAFEGFLQMGRGSLKDTAFSEDDAAADWFARVVLAYQEGRLPEEKAALAADENCEKWRQTPIRYATGRWILSLLDTQAESILELRIP